MLKKDRDLLVSAQSNPISQLLGLFDHLQSIKNALKAFNIPMEEDNNSAILQILVQILAQQAPPQKPLPQETQKEISTLESSLTDISQFLELAKNANILPSAQATPPQPPATKPTQQTQPPSVQELLRQAGKEYAAIMAQKTLASMPQPLSKSPPKQELKLTSKEPILANKVSISSPGQVVVHNDIYKVNLGRLGARELNLLFSLFNRLKDQQDTCVRFSPQEVKNLMNDPKSSNADLLKVVRTLWSNIKAANFQQIAHVVENGMEIVQERDFNLFSGSTIAMNKEKTRLLYLDIKVNTDCYLHLFNQLSANFTAFQLKIFLSLNSKYAKNLYRLLVRFEDVRKNGMCEMLTYRGDFEGFREFMGIPKSMEIGIIEERVLRPACRELGHFFPPPSKRSKKQEDTPYDPANPDRSKPYETIFYVKEKKGRKIVGVTFHFMPHPHADAQKAILKRHSQNRVQEVALEQQRQAEKEKRKLEKAQRESQQGYCNKQERESLKEYCGLIGGLYIKTPEHFFKSIRLASVATRLGNNPNIVALFQLIEPSPNDIHIAKFCTEHIERFNCPKEGYFTHVFKDIEDFIGNFVQDAR
ncbi:replication initiation protein [Helicobacter felis]|uniref:Replication initiation protein A n=1 Tax=Helicobacter felis (strain ATCC 49179 / CCUG 28539 / NCTC 12436 / CS1) TaxID=936155 RepID=E7ABE0_HELFC|nr:replication initiation protein [Helicobacter felis]CBY83698.1 replication initiation protein A [Helicobacter felis ATCC 49179]